MAVIEIARIQVRRGQENQTGVPQLAGGEFAWAADTEKLYIGLKREDGGSRDDNVEILTENSLKNIFNSLSPLSTSTPYIYRVGTLITSDDGVNEFSRSVQARLDDGDVTIENFGEVGNGDNDDRTFQYAIDNLFLNARSLPDDPTRVLTLPPKEFLISETIYISKNTVIRGQGPDKTILKVVNPNIHVFQTVDSASVGGITGYLTFPSINSNTQPDYIRIENLTLEYATSVTTTQALSLLSLDCSNYAEINNVKFKGNYNLNGTTATDYVGVDIRGLGAVTSENVLIKNCDFVNLYYGIKSNYDIISPIIENCRFYDLNRGVVFNDPIDAAGIIGPRHARISKNRFENIERQAVYYGENNSNFSADTITRENQYVNVGNYVVWGEESSTGTSVLSFLSDDNKSIDDFFNKFEYHFNLATTATFLPLIEGNSVLTLTGNRSVVIDFSETKKIISIPITNREQNLTINYNATSAQPLSRSGTLKITIGNNTSPNIGIVDDYIVTSDSDALIIWSASRETDTNNIVLNFSNNSSANITLDINTTLQT